ncbi:MAG: tetratricopeptide repeat protein, partial [Tissierellaceae bacterium]
GNLVGLIEYYIDEKSLEKEFLELEKFYREFSCAKCKDCIEEEILYLYLHGRFNKNRGDIKGGLDYLNRMIYIAEDKGYYEYAYNGYLQLAHYYVNTNNLAMMEKVINRAEDVSNILNDMCKNAIVWRLKGYFNMLSGNYKEGEEYIYKALRVFDTFENREKYILNIVACEFYLGESYRLQKVYEDALNHYFKSLRLCDDNEDCPAAALIFSKIGYVKYEQGIIDEAQFYYLKSLKAYDNTIFAWGRSEVYYYLYSIYAAKDMMEKANGYLEEGLKYLDRYTSEDMKNKIYKILNSQK